MNTTPVIMLKNQLHKYRKLDLESKGVIASYIWIDGTGINMRSKDRTLPKYPLTIAEVPKWHYDGSQTDQAPPEDCDIDLYPRMIYKNPFHGESGVLILTETYYKKKASATNYRKECEKFCKGITLLEPWFGFNQEFVLMSTVGRPLDFPLVGTPPGDAAKNRYCATGIDKISTRDLMDTFYRCCQYAEISIYGINSGPSPSLWNFQVGPSVSMKAADDLWMARYILARLAEEYNAVATFEPNSFPGSLLHLYTTYSDDDTREAHTGYQAIKERIQALSHVHGAHMAEYNSNIKVKEIPQYYPEQDIMPSIEGFTTGVGDREVSIRIPKHVHDEKSGFFEDRRPVSNADPYRIIPRIMKTLLDTIYPGD